MITMIVFLVLTVILIIFTSIYTNYQKKKNKNSIDIPLNQEVKGKKKTKKQLSNLLQIKFKDNIICINNRYSIVLKLGSIDYNMLSNSEQDTIENILVQTALSIDYPIQFFSTMEYIDTTKIIEIINKNKTYSIEIQQYKKHLVEYLNNLMENRTVAIIKNYAIISYDGLYKQAIEELNRKALTFKASLLRASIICDVLTENELYNLIYRELNKNSTLNINNLSKGGKNLYVEKKEKRKKY